MKLKEKFDEIPKSLYKRIDASHILDIYIGYNEKGCKTMTIVEFGEIDNIESTRMIEVNLKKRTDNKLSLSFSLLDENMSDMFYNFCEDIIESSRKINKQNAILFIIKRWKNWINLFKNPYSVILTENEIKGLLGELIFLDKYMFRKYGIEKSLNSWIGTCKSHKDYEIDDTWYEIKAIRENSLTVKISSIEQLDSNYNGELVIIRLEPSNNSIREPITLNNYIQKISEQINSDNLKKFFKDKLLEIGYFYTEEYDKFVYSLKRINRYLVNDKFPKITLSDLKTGIVRASYEIDIDNLSDFKIEGD